MATRRLLSLRHLSAVPLVGATVYAVGNELEGRGKVKVKELPIYGTPQEPELVFIDEKLTPFRHQVSGVRKVVWEYMDSMKDTTDKVKDMYSSAKQYGNDTLASVREDTAVLQRAALITVAGLGGIVAGYKGGVVRKAVFAGTAMVATASVVYPRQAVDIASRNWDKARGEALDLWKNQTGGSKSSAPAESNTPVEEKKSAATSPAPVEGDHGQSKPEDKDMYSTRG